MAPCRLLAAEDLRSSSSPAVAVNASDGSVLVAGSSGHRVRKIWPNGTLSTFAGTGTARFSGDGALATAAELHNPQGVAVNTSDGSLLIADTSNHRVRRVWLNGTISTVAGGSIVGIGGDGGPATAAQLNNPYAVALNPLDGSWLIADRLGGCVRQVWPNGTISTAAANGPSVTFADGGPATAPVLASPVVVAVDPRSGWVFVADAGTQRVRIGFPNGTIGTLAGGGPLGAPVEGWPAGEAISARASLCIRRIVPYSSQIL